jgi:diguanylate cyclase (GGDEF)-like protein
LQPVPSEAGAGLGNPAVIGLLIDSRQQLWVDTAVTGLHRLTGWADGRARFDPVSMRHGVVNRPFGVNLLEDRRGRIWSHLYVYEPAGDHLDELTAADGVSLGTGWFRSYAKAADGRLLFGGSKGLMVVEPERFEVSRHAPALVATDLRINGQSRPTGTFRDGLQLAPGDRSFSLGFAALDYSDPARVRYAYLLRGFDPDWIQTDADLRVASYSNLSPGRYVLHVRATNRNGIWSPHEIAIDVEVLPAWWQTDAFLLAVLATSALLLFAALRGYTGRMRRRQEALARKVQERTADLHAATAALQVESAALAEASLTDPLTGLRNRRFLSQHIEAEIAQAQRRHETALAAGVPAPTDADLIFFLVDIDMFKAVNDEHGHAAGDAVIRQMRDRLRPVFRDSDYLVRWGGEEFLIVARGTSRGHAAELAERARAAVADRPFVLDDGALLPKTCSVGFCCFPLSPGHPTALSWGDTVNLADSALLHVKRSGRNGWLGLLAAYGDSPEDLRAGARKPLDDWRRSGEVEVAARPA